MTLEEIEAEWPLALVALDRDCAGIASSGDVSFEVVYGCSFTALDVVANHYPVRGWKTSARWDPKREKWHTNRRDYPKELRWNRGEPKTQPGYLKRRRIE